MSDTQQKTTQKKTLKVIAIIGAWLTIPVIGLSLLLLTVYSSTIYEAGVPTDTLLPLNGLLGIFAILLLLNLTHRYRKRVFIFHLRIGFFIGLGIYTLILLSGVGIILYANNHPGLQTCTSASQQYRDHSSAVIPIATDQGYGTGFAINNGSTIITAYHVVDGAKNIKANYSSGAVRMKIIDKAPQYDLALLKLDEPVDSYFMLSDSYITGDDVLAYGYPGNALTAGPPSLSTGIISRIIDIADLRMTVQDAPSGLELVQTDAAINPGISGGPLIGRCGVIGVVSFTSDTSELHQYTGSVSEQNIGFAISSKTVKAAFPEYAE